ncbi:SRPBCC family protein [Kineococcus terrestris]|uniref:SRPBCC family protein n=1 Tax=Kineococcus terrestris TaxID=2044856 RepID=UPI0034DAD0FB
MTAAQDGVRQSPDPTTAGALRLAVHVDRPAQLVHSFARDPENLPRWSSGVGDAVEHEDGEWWVRTPAGRARFRFTGDEPGVLDHEVLTPAGESVRVPLRVVPDGEGCEVVFTLLRPPGAGQEEFARDAAAVRADLARLKRVAEALPG